MMAIMVAILIMDTVLPTAAMVMPRLIMLPLLSTMQLLLLLSLPVIGKHKMSGYQEQIRGTGLTSIMTRAVMCGC